VKATVIVKEHRKSVDILQSYSKNFWLVLNSVHKLLVEASITCLEL